MTNHKKDSRKEKKISKKSSKHKKVTLKHKNKNENELIFIKNLKNMIGEFMQNQNTLEATINALTSKSKKSFFEGKKIKSNKDKNALFMIYKQRIQILQKILLFINTHKTIFTEPKHIQKINKLQNIYINLLKSSLKTIKILIPSKSTNK